MSYKCPLCLAELTEGVQLERFCRDHPHLGSPRITINDSEEALPSEIFCPGGDGQCNNAIETGVFLHHVACPARNPFWDTDRVDIPGSDSTTDYQLNLPDGPQNIKVTHWEIGMLRNVPSVEEMWFPLMLLRATAETQKRISGRRVGSLVELAGSSKVGKTVLAMQAMEYEGYTPDPSSSERHVEVRGYIFSRLPEKRTAKTNPFLGTLYLSYLMRLNRNGIFETPGTFRLPGDVKVAFIAPSPERTTSSSPRTGEPDHERGIVKRVAANVWDMMKGIKDIFWSSQSHEAFWYTVAFYDVAGEAFIVGDETPDAIERAADRVAILIDATEIFGMTTGDSIAIANERISRARERRLPHCLVVTKLDLVMDRLSQEAQQAVRRVAEDLRIDPEVEAQNLLVSWLSQQIDDDSVKQLKNRLPNIDRVFFVWTENLPTATTTHTVQTTSQQPRSYGLARFICWCLDTPWEAINHK